MIAEISLVVSVLALAVSALTAWLALLRRGSIRMTHPTVVFFGPEGRPKPHEHSVSKVFLRTLMYSTSKRGWVVENMYVRLRRGETSQNFNVWGYADEKNVVTRGSGLYIPENGVGFYHHFSQPSDGTEYQFLAGAYVLDVYVSLAGKKKPRMLHSIQLRLEAEYADALRNNRGVIFDWGPDAGEYHPRIREDRP